MSESSLIFIAGPTAGGKSAAALAFAKSRHGEIVNADSMQIYRDLRIITARPSPQEEAEVPHHLYGMLDGAENWSAGKWARAAADAIADIKRRGNPAIVVGGTGLYFRALEDGLSPIPETPDDIRYAAQERRKKLGPARFREEVVAQDAAMARLPEGDTQRLLRAWEVYAATGKPLSEFQSLPRRPLIEGPVTKAVISPSREKLYSQCDARAEMMFSLGAVEEARMLLVRNLGPDLPVMKALGVQEIAAFLKGDMTREAALGALQQNTRRFAKRQMTWFRNQAKDWPVYETPEAAVDALGET